MIGQLLDKRYRILQVLGSGGFGCAYLAEDIRLYNRSCVVKQFKPYATDATTLKIAKRLFDAEAEVLHQLGTHNQIPQLLDHFEEDQEFYLVQELIEGHSLDHEIISGKQLSESYGIALLRSLLEPLSFVHQHQKIHRDIKPTNLIRRAGDGKIILIDFGAVKQIPITRVVNSQGRTELTIALGTVGYMPSEQMHGKPKPSSDIYATGIVCLQALTGREPQDLPEDPHTAEILWQELVEVSPALAAILEKMVRYDFRQRYASATEALQDIQQLENSVPIPATEVLQDIQQLENSVPTPPPPSEAPSPKFDTYEFPSYPRVTYLGGERFNNTDGRSGLWDTFSSNDPPEVIFEFYRQQLGDTGFSGNPLGGTWEIELRKTEGDRTSKILEIRPIDTYGPHRQYDNMRPAAARSAILDSRITSMVYPERTPPEPPDLPPKAGWKLWMVWLLSCAVGEAVLNASLAGVEVTNHVGFGIAGAIGGALGGVLQWFILRRYFARASWWILATTLGAAVGNIVWSIVIFAQISDGSDSNRARIIIISALYFGVNGILQWLILRRHFFKAGWWVLVSILGGTLAGAAYAILPPSSDTNLAAYGAMAGATYGAVTGGVLIWLLRQPKNQGNQQS
ncbi:MAG: protein kinase [Acaryochloris sp. SU_5_25]|nr:protein kinase [Acaryochloris sp. SU_5_25]